MNSSISNRIIYSIIFLFFAFFATAQAQDKLIGKGGQYTSSDSTIAKALLDTAQTFLNFGAGQLAIPYLQESQKAYIASFGEKYWRVGYVWGKIGLANFQLGEYQKSKLAYEKALLIVVPARPQSISIPDYYHNLAIIHSIHHNYPKAMEYMEQSILPTIKLFGEISEENRLTYLNLSSFNLNIRNLEKAFEYNLKSLKIGKKLYKKDAEELISNYINMGAILVELRSFERANFYLLKALNLSKRYPNKNRKEELPVLYSKYSKLELTIGNFEKALYYIEIMENYCKENLPPNHYFLNFAYTLKASIYIETKDFEQAKHYMKLKHQDLSNAYVQAEYHNFLGKANVAQKKYQTAIEKYQIALDIMHNENTFSNYNKARINIEMAKAYFKNNQLKLAEEKLKLALQHLGFKDVFKNEFVTNYALFLYEFDFAIDLYNKFYTKTKDEKYLTIAENYAQYAIQLVEIKNQSPSEINQYMLAEQVHSLLSKAIHTQYLRYEKTKDKTTFLKALNAAERSKSYLLKKALQQREALNEADDASHLFEKEKDLRIKITYLEKDFHQKNNDNPWFHDSLLVEIKLQLSQLKEEHLAIKNQLKREYKEFFEFKNSSYPSLTLENIQQNLIDKNSSILEYVVGEEEIYAFIIQKNNYAFIKIKKDFPLEDWVKKMNQEGIYGYHEKSKYERSDSLKAASLQNYTKYAHLICKKLIAPFQQQLAHTERVVIIPDGELSAIPFEALLTNSVSKKRLGKYKRYPFFIFQHTPSYAYSILLLEEMGKKKNKQLATKSVLAIAPFYEKNVAQNNLVDEGLDYLNLRKEWNMLESSGEEVDSIAKMWGGESWLGKESTLQKFNSGASFYRIIHFATHSKMDNGTGKFSYLAITDSIPLTTSDLYNFNFNADAVILSACETGKGKMRSGEGIIGLTRAFSYAGAKSVFATLWKVNDSHTKDLMILFHKNLKKGMLKDEALVSAKQTYLENNSDKKENLHPFFWAGMIGIGDMSAIKN